MRLGSVLLAVLTGGVIASGCNTAGVPECAEGEIRYRGRPPRRMFKLDCTCRADCFSLPKVGPGCATQDSYARCAPDCGLVDVEQPSGQLRGALDVFAARRKSIGSRALVLVDASSMADDGRALVFEFGYEDVEGGEAPTDWSFFAAGPRTYRTYEVQGSARFLMRAGVAKDRNENGTYNLDAGACRFICAADSDCPGSQRCRDEGVCALAAQADGSPDADSETSPLACSRTADCQANQVCVAGGEVEAAQGDVVYADPGRLEIRTATDNRISGRFFLGFESPTGQFQTQVNGCFDLPVRAAQDGRSRLGER